jgi:hypothetical protein
VQPEAVVSGPPGGSDRVRSVDQQRIETGLTQPRCDRKPGWAGADDDDLMTCDSATVAMHVNP